MDLNVEAILEDVFEGEKEVSRQDVRVALSQNPLIISSNLKEPIQDQLLRQLESVSSGKITQKDLNEAIIKV